MVSKVLRSSIEYGFLTSIESIISIIVLIISGYFLQVRGIISTLVLPVNDGILSISEAAKRADMSEDRINNNFIKKGIKSYLIQDIIFYIQLCYNKHTKLKEVAL